MLGEAFNDASSILASSLASSLVLLLGLLNNKELRFSRDASDEVVISLGEFVNGAESSLFFVLPVLLM